MNTKLTKGPERWGVIIYPDGSKKYMPMPKSRGKFSLEELQRAIGGYITFGGRREENLIIMDEEGLIRERPINREGSLIAGFDVYGPIALIPDKLLN